MRAGSKPVHCVPEDTYNAARRIYNIRHSYLCIGDQLDEVLNAIDLALLDPTARLNGDMLLRLALLTVFQYVEALPDPVASEATLRRMDLKYALYLPVNHPGISSAFLCEFRQNLFTSPTGWREFGYFFAQLVKIGLPTQLPDGSADPLQVLHTVCNITRLYRLNQAMKTVLGVLSSNHTDWLRTVALPHWYQRYKTGRIYQSIHPGLSKPVVEATALGADIRRLLAALQQPEVVGLSLLPEIRSLKVEWEDQYEQEQGAVHWRMPCCASCVRHPLGEG